eukprot:3435600-Rhodomonas_salina.14
MRCYWACAYTQGTSSYNRLYCPTASCYMVSGVSSHCIMLRAPLYQPTVMCYSFLSGTDVGFSYATLCSLVPTTSYHAMPSGTDGGVSGYTSGGSERCSTWR